MIEQRLPNGVVIERQPEPGRYTITTDAPNPAGIPELDIPGMVAALKARGYRVSKPAAKRSDALSAAMVSACVHCGGPTRHVTAIGGKRQRDKRKVGLCTDCYRFGPRMHSIPVRPENPEHAARLLRVWRRAHNRMAARARRYGWHSPQRRNTEALAGRILRAMDAEPMIREYTPESKIPGRRIAA